MKQILTSSKKVSYAVYREDTCQWLIQAEPAEEIGKLRLDWNIPTHWPVSSAVDAAEKAPQGLSPGVTKAICAEPNFSLSSTVIKHVVRQCEEEGIPFAVFRREETIVYSEIGKEAVYAETATAK